jgi:hypothetical protein
MYVHKLWFGGWPTHRTTWPRPPPRWSPSWPTNRRSHPRVCQPTAGAQNRTDHFLTAQDHLGYHKTGPEEREQLARWLLDRALEHDRPLLLWQLACEKLAADKVVRPGVTVLERMVIAARRGAERETVRRLAGVLDEPGRALLDCLLTPEGSTDRTPRRPAHRHRKCPHPLHPLASRQEQGVRR